MTIRVSLLWNQLPQSFRADLVSILQVPEKLPFVSEDTGPIRECLLFQVVQFLIMMSTSYTSNKHLTVHGIIDKLIKKLVIIKYDKDRFRNHRSTYLRMEMEALQDASSSAVTVNYYN